MVYYFSRACKPDINRLPNKFLICFMFFNVFSKMILAFSVQITYKIFPEHPDLIQVICQNEDGSYLENKPSWQE